MLDKRFIESIYATFEDRAVGPIKRIIDTCAPPRTPEDRYDLTTFIALQATRTRRSREDLPALATLAMRQHVKNIDRTRATAWMKEHNLPSDPTSVEEFIDRAAGPQGPRLVIDKGLAIQQSLCVAIESFTRAIWQRSWSVLRSETPSILTSDKPVCAWTSTTEPVTIANAPIVLRQHHIIGLT